MCVMCNCHKNFLAGHMPSGDAAFKEIVADRMLTVLRRLAKRGMVAKTGTSRNAKWGARNSVSAEKRIAPPGDGAIAVRGIE